MSRRSWDGRAQTKEPGVEDIDPGKFEQMARQARRDLRVNREGIEATSRGTPSAKPNEWRLGKSPSMDRRR